MSGNVTSPTSCGEAGIETSTTSSTVPLPTKASEPDTATVLAGPYGQRPSSSGQSCAAAGGTHSARMALATNAGTRAMRIGFFMVSSGELSPL